MSTCFKHGHNFIIHQTCSTDICMHKLDVMTVFVYFDLNLLIGYSPSKSSSIERRIKTGGCGYCLKDCKVGKQ